MFNLPKPAAFINLKGLKTLEVLKRLRTAPQLSTTGTSPLHETLEFGSNPGQLRMFSHMPNDTERPCPLVVVLHGCGQTAEGYAHGAGWLAMADRYGFALLMPEQQRANNPNGCFNWFQPEDTRRGSGEAASIHQMIETMVRDHGVDSSRVFVTGLSAGGAMTCVMLACYPETFAAGAIIAGLPYGAASNVQQALNSMYQCPPRPAKHWGDLVRNAGPRPTTWPRVSVWHGTADKTVIPGNAREIIKQWTDVHGLAAEPSAESKVNGFQRQVWRNKTGEEIVESYSITHMAHGTPLATGDADTECGNVGPFLLETGISSSFHIASFFGLTPAHAKTAGRTQKATTTHSIVPAQPETAHREQPEKAPANQDWPKADAPHFDPGAVIKAALRKAGLIPG